MPGNYPVAAGIPTLESYVSTLYAAKLLKHFYPATFFREIANTDYEGQIKKHGDEVQVRLLPEILIKDYVKGQNLVYDRPSPTHRTLKIDKGHYFGVPINLVDVRQSDVDFVDAWGMHASESLKVSVDKKVLAECYADVDASNAGATAGARSGSFNLGAAGSPLSVTKANILDVLVDCGTVLDEQDIPESERWMVLPAWACGKIKKSDLKDASITGDGESTLRNGRIGKIDNFTIYKSNQLATATDGSDTVTNAIFGHKCALTFAAQITEKEIIANPNDFGSLLRGLMIYGFEVIQPTAMGRLYITAGSDAA